jgi:hypothetical protein
LSDSKNELRYNWQYFEVHGDKFVMKLQVGQIAPEFTLPSHLDKSITLRDLRGNNVVLAFFPLAWTPI